MIGGLHALVKRLELSFGDDAKHVFWASASINDKYRCDTLYIIAKRLPQILQTREPLQEKRSIHARPCQNSKLLVLVELEGLTPTVSAICRALSLASLMKEGMVGEALTSLRVETT